MKTGKLDASALIHQVFPYTGIERPEVVLRSKIGEDSAAVELGEWNCVFSSDPITGAIANNGWLAVHVSCNDIVSNGAEPIGVLLTLLMSENSTEQDVSMIMESAHKAAKELKIEIIGGHTEFTLGLKQNIICATAIGKVKKGALITTSGAKPGDDLILTKGAGIEGTSILAADYREFLSQKISEAILEEAENLINCISVVPEGRIAAALKVHAMHDVTEGGVLGAVYELAEASQVGVEIKAEEISILPATKAICAQLQIDPLKLISSGSMLIAAQNGPKLLHELKKQGINASIIGKTIEEKSKTLIQENRRVTITKPESDELWTAKQRMLRN
ncbi:AIR synthase family protein [Bacillota bacterium LX-D]|nr:AIR synthase family protein [Bacillota bacterium LX-D]